MADDKKKAPAPAAKKKAQKITKPYKAGKSCPRCGSGVTLADHKDRRSCGKCGYFEKK
ncbi:30S ribosomal protein S27ae [Candidatus Micrarchaeota archaeon]|nr:30S ribosomal protein S27ae [Candidatus Micrarchaeota archaeon]